MLGFLVAVVGAVGSVLPPVPAWLVGRWEGGDWEYRFYPNRTFTASPYRPDGFHSFSAWMQYRGTFDIDRCELVLDYGKHHRIERWWLPEPDVRVERFDPSFAVLTGTARPTALTFPHLLQSFQPMDRTRLGVEWPYRKLPPRGTK